MALCRKSFWRYIQFGGKFLCGYCQFRYGNIETALLKTPQVVVYHVFGGVLASVLKKLVIKTRYISLVNLIADKELVSELVAHQFTRRNMIVELTKILNDKAYRQTILESYAEIDRRLLPLKAAENAAEGIINRLV